LAEVYTVPVLLVWILYFIVVHSEVGKTMAQ